MENTRRRLMELKEGLQDIECRMIFMGTVMTSEIELGEKGRAGAVIYFNELSRDVSALSALAQATNMACMTVDQDKAPS